MTNTTHQPSNPLHSSHSKFDALRVSFEIIRELRGPLGKVRRRSRKLGEQLESAASSIAANVAEGNGRKGRDRVHFFRIAEGSARETRAHLWAAEAWGYLKWADIEQPLALLDRELAMLWKLTRG